MFLINLILFQLLLNLRQLDLHITEHVDASQNILLNLLLLLNVMALVHAKQGTPFADPAATRHT